MDKYFLARARKPVPFTNRARQHVNQTAQALRIADGLTRHMALGAPALAPQLGALAAVTVIAHTQAGTLAQPLIAALTKPAKTALV